MERPPTIREVEDALQEQKIPQVDRLHRLEYVQDELLARIAEAEQVDSALMRKAMQLRRLIRAQQRLVFSFPERVYRTLLLQPRDSEEFEAIAVVPQDSASIRPVRIRGWNVMLLPCNWHLLRCREADFTTLGLVVSVNGSPILPKAKREQAVQTEQERAVNARERRQYERERRKLARERLYHERVERQRQIAELKEIRELQEEIRRREARQRLEYEAWQREQMVRAETEAYMRRWEARAAQEHQSRVVSANTGPEQPAPAKRALSGLRSLVQAQVIGFGLGCLLGLLFASPYFSLVGLAGVLLASVYWTATREPQN